MASKTALPIARLRALGCRVSTVIGHDPRIGDWIYSVRVPDSVGDLREMPEVRQDAAATARSAQGMAMVKLPRHSDGHHLIVNTALYRVGVTTDRQLVQQAERDVAALLSALADVLNGR